MARCYDLSPAHFQKLFKANLGRPPIAYLRHIRLEKACELIEKTYIQMKQIGVIVGMPDESHFTRDFKKEFGLTPTEYRRQCWQKDQARMSAGQK
jgi:AraC family L-rhamnose operon transcriptional activator RhaR